MKRWFFIALSIIMSKIHAQGFNFDEGSYLKREVLPETRAQIKSSVDFSMYVPLNYEQFGGTCVAHAFSKARATLLNKKLNITDPNKKAALSFSPYWIYFNLTTSSDYKCSKGLDPEKAAKFVLNYGFAPLASVEYPNYYPFTNNCLGNPYPNTYPLNYKNDLVNAKQYRFTDIYRCANLNQIRSALSDGLLVVAGFYVNDRFKSCRQSYFSLGNNELPGKMGHAMLVVGYSDIKYGGSFKIANSWGSGWGDNGFVWIDYLSFYKMLIASYACSDKKYWGDSKTDDSSSDIVLRSSLEDIKIPSDNNFENIDLELPFSEDDRKKLEELIISQQSDTN